MDFFNGKFLKPKLWITLGAVALGVTACSGYSSHTTDTNNRDTARAIPITRHLTRPQPSPNIHNTESSKEARPAPEQRVRSKKAQRKASIPTPVERNQELSNQEFSTHSPHINPMREAPNRRPEPRKLSTFDLAFDPKQENRATNITLAAKAIDGTVVNPGAVFSYNDIVGPTNEKRGYKESIVFVDGEKEKGFGGGVCQVSTALHQAAKQAGLTILERHDHSRPVEYAASGEEAATSYGGIDFKFQNDKSHPVKIEASARDGKIRINIVQV